jgi:hypothetical protein
MKQSAIRAALVTGAAALVLGGLTASAAPARATELCFGLAPTIVGTEGDDTINGTSGVDVIVGLGGADVIQGLAGSDTICAGPGADTVYGASVGAVTGDDPGPGGWATTRCPVARVTTRSTAPPATTRSPATQARTSSTAAVETIC